uniref:Transmembrane protein 237a n=1 Tax=Callorhinchus milii TaxID=7868 RepID=A0A4W3H6M4_CALMI
MEKDLRREEIPLSKPRKKKTKSTNGVESAVSTGRRLSEARGSVTLDPIQKKKKKRKSLPAPDLETTISQQSVSDGSYVYTGQEENQTEGELIRKTRKRAKKSRLAELEYTNELGVEEDDIISDGLPPRPHGPLFAISPGTSHPVDKVFLERNRRFQATDRADLVKTSEPIDVYMEVKSWSTKDVALQMYRGFGVIGLFVNGFLAGYAVWNIVVIYMLAGHNLSATNNLLENYRKLAYPNQCLLYLLITISTVAAFDRINLAKTTMLVRGIITLDPAAWASFFYFMALILTVSQQQLSDRIQFYLVPGEPVPTLPPITLPTRAPIRNITIWPPGSELTILYPWIVVNLIVALLVGLAWVFLSTQPLLDHTEDLMFALDTDEFPELEDRTKTQT